MNDAKTQELINLLPHIYHDCNVFLLKNKEDFMSYRLSHPLRLAFNNLKTEEDTEKFFHCNIENKMIGQYYPAMEEAQIYLFNIKENLEAQVVFTLFHELRHHYQDRKGILIRNNEKLLERDCDLFALRMIVKHKIEIAKILGRNVFEGL